MIVSFVGHSEAGKTTLLCRIISELKKKGYTVAIVKHTNRPFSHADLDSRGKDTFRFCEAGADYVALSSFGFSFLEINGPIDILEMVRPLKVDFVLVEGFKEKDIPKVVFAENDEELKLIKGNVLAVISEKLPGAIRPDELEKISSLLIDIGQ